MKTARRKVKRTLKLKCSHDEMPALHRFLRRTLLKILGKQVGKELTATVILAAHEAFTNIVRHARAHESQEDILVHCREAEEVIEVELVDEGVEFRSFELSAFCDDVILEKLQHVEDLNDLEEAQIAGGYGIPIIQAATTATKYRRSPSGKNHLYLYFEIPKAEREFVI